MLKRIFVFAIVSGSFAMEGVAQAQDSSLLTIYNQNFAVVRTNVDLELKPGITEVTTTAVTRLLEPDSVVLRDVKGGRALNVLEQNYDSAVVTENLLLEKFEGQTIDFQTLSRRTGTGENEITTTPGRIVRAPDDNGRQPIIETDGKLIFHLPGTPIFPARADSLLLKPTLRWRIRAENLEKVNAELNYITGGLSWQSTYNIVLPEHGGDTATVPATMVGWVTIQNNSGTDFPVASLKLMAGDVAKIQILAMKVRSFNRAEALAQAPQSVTQKAFDDFHLYDLHRTVDLRDGETKQVEFMRAAKVPVTRKYAYDGAEGVNGGDDDGANTERGFGVGGSHKVTITQEFKNSEANQLGIPLPAGKLRFYRQEQDGQVEFTGESTIDHTPKDGTIRVVTGNAFDMTGDRRQTDFRLNNPGRTIDESFAIKLKNAKDERAVVDVTERLYRWSNWKITAKSADFVKQDSRTIQFPVELAANEEKTVTYTVHYAW